MQEFRKTAEFYSALANEEQRMEREGPFLAVVFGQAPGKRVADIACGTGLHARYFAALGAEVSGFDLSEEMVSAAGRMTTGASVKYAQGDMRQLSGGPYDLVICLGNSLSLLPAMEDVRTTYANVYGRLAPGGLFLTQTLNYAAEKAKLPRHRVERKTVDGVDITAVKNLVPLGGRTLLAVAFCAEAAGERRTVSETSLLLHISPEELIGAAVAAGFQDVDIYGGLSETPYDARRSPDIVTVARKTL